MMLKVILYAYMNNIEKFLHRDIHFIWLTGYEKPDFITINRFRNRVKKEINEVFTQTILNHSSVAITKHYLGLRQEELLNTYDCLSF